MSLFENRVLLNYILSHARGDERPYLDVTVYGYSFKGLLDSGATRTILGSSGWDVLKNSGIKLHKTTLECTVASGAVCSCLGFIRAPVQLLDTVHLLEILVVPSVSHTLILGIDFWKSMEIVPNLRDGVWTFSEVESNPVVASVTDETSLTFSQKYSLDELIKSEIARKPSSLGCTNVAQHHIELLPGAQPIKQRYYPVSPPKQKIIDTELRKMLEMGFIEQSKSAWSSPVCLVRKKDNSYRFCVDYRRLNAVTKKDAYPIPYISSILDRLRNATFISSLDVKSAFWQVSLTPESREYTAFTVPGRGLFQFKRMPFGLTGAPATWQRIIDTVLKADLEPSVFVYLDDIIVVSQGFDDHLQTLSLVFERLRDAGIMINFEKCQFCRPQLRYLGFVVDRFGLRPDP